MTESKGPKQTPEEKQLEKEATGESDLVILTNGSGEVKKLSPEEWKSQRDTLLAAGWVEIGDAERA